MREIILRLNADPNTQEEVWGRKMGAGDSKLHFRKAVIQLTTKTRVGFSQ